MMSLSLHRGPCFTRGAGDGAPAFGRVTTVYPLPGRCPRARTLRFAAKIPKNFRAQRVARDWKYDASDSPPESDLGNWSQIDRL